MEMHPKLPGVWTPTGPPTNHGFYLIGDKTIILSHIPVFMAPHDVQAFLEISFAPLPDGRNPADIYRADREKTGNKIYTLKSTEIVLPDVATTDSSRKLLKQFSGRIYQGNFLSSGTPLIEHVVVTINNVFYFETFKEKPAALAELTYFCFRTQSDVYLVHAITMPPDFDQVLTAKVSGISDENLSKKAVKVVFPNRANSEDKRLKEKETATGNSELGPLEVEVNVEEIFDAASLADAMPEMESPLETGRPVASVPIEFQWHKGTWKELFDKHVNFIQLDIKRALADNRFVIYLSCPISSRGGSLSITNVEIAAFVAQKLTADWGPQFWVLNPGQYQMESQQGLGLIRMHAYELGLEKKTTIDVDQLMDDQPTIGGDYMRMWTRVLAEDDDKSDLGSRFSAYYFLSPSDVRAFFAQAGAKSVSAGVESYFARKFVTDSHFRAFFSLPLVDEMGAAISMNPANQVLELEKRRREFFRYYAVKSSAYFSKGSHDEWNIWQKLNQLRIADRNLGIGSQIPGYFEGLQIDPSAAEAPISAGYATPQTPTVVPPTAHATQAVHALEEHGMKM